MTSVVGESSISDKKDFDCQMSKNQNSPKIRKRNKIIHAKIRRLLADQNIELKSN